MSWYEQRILPGLINLACGTKPTRKQREKIVPRAVGDVLEVGFGTGLNLPFYERDKVRHLWALEPSEGMRRRAQRAIEHGHIEAELIEQPCEEIPLDDNSADTVVVTYTMCSIAELLPALEGVRRVLKPTGQLLFCEHGKAPDQSVYKWQERLNPIWRRVSGGCNIHRDIPAILHESGFKIEDDNRMYIPGIKALSYNYWGAARIR